MSKRNKKRSVVKAKKRKAKLARIKNARCKPVKGGRGKGMIECKYCDFNKTQTFFPTQALLIEKRGTDSISLISSKLQIDYENNYLIGVDVFSKETCFLTTSVKVKFCPMCGRELGD